MQLTQYIVCVYTTWNIFDFGHSLKVAALEQQVVRIVSWIVSSFKKSLMMTTEKTATAGIPSPCLKNEEKKQKKTVTRHDPLFQALGFLRALQENRGEDTFHFLVCLLVRSGVQALCTPDDDYGENSNSGYSLALFKE